MPSVVIPAYNEANGIERCLRALLADGVPDLVVVVVPNACRDDTAARARAVPVPPGTQVIVVETAQGGKTNALNLGERTLREQGLDRFPRLFLDGDIELAPGSLGALFAAAGGTEPRVVAATPRFDTDGCSLAVRLFYAAEERNPYHLEGAPNGSGTYCVNAAGRARWREFPDVIADDGFVERQFAAGERSTVAAASARVRVPRSVRALRGIAARKRLGTRQLDAVAPAPAGTRRPAGTLRAMCARMLPDPRLWPALAVFVAFRALERIERRLVARERGQARWKHDESSRR
jgi:hypothetical protein